MKAVDQVFRNYNKFYADQFISKDVMIEILNKIEPEVFLVNYSFSYVEIFEHLAHNNLDPTKIQYKQLQRFVYDDIETKKKDLVEIDITIYLSVLNELRHSTQVISRNEFEEYMSMSLDKLNRKFYQILIQKFTKNTQLDSAINFLQNLRENISSNMLQVSTNPFQMIFIHSFSHMQKKKLESTDEFFQYLMNLPISYDEILMLEQKIQEYKDLLAREKLQKSLAQSYRSYQSHHSYRSDKFSTIKKQQIKFEEHENNIQILEEEALLLQKTLQQVKTDRDNQQQYITSLLNQVAELKAYNKDLKNKIADLHFNTQHLINTYFQEKEELIKENKELTIIQNDIKKELTSLKEINQTYVKEFQFRKNEDNHHIIEEKQQIHQFSNGNILENSSSPPLLKNSENQDNKNMDKSFLNVDNQNEQRQKSFLSIEGYNPNYQRNQIANSINDLSLISSNNNNPNFGEVGILLNTTSKKSNIKSIHLNPQIPMQHVNDKIKESVIKSGAICFCVPIMIIQFKRNSQTRILYLTEKQMFLTQQTGEVKENIIYQMIKQIVLLRNENWIIIRLRSPQNKDLFIETFCRQDLVMHLLKFTDLKIQKERIILYPQNKHTTIHLNKGKLSINEIPKDIMHPMRHLLNFCSFGGSIYLKQKGIMTKRFQEYFAILNQYLIVLYKDFDMNEVSSTIAILPDCQFEKFEIKNLQAIRIMYRQFPHIQYILAFKSWQSRQTWSKLLDEKVNQTRQSAQARKQKAINQINAILRPSSILEPVPI